MAWTLTYECEFEIPDEIDLTNCNTWIEDDTLHIQVPGVEEIIKIEGAAQWSDQ